MKKTGLLSLVVLAASVAVVGCSSSETVQPPQTTSAAPVEQSQIGQNTASVAAIEEDGGAAAHADPALQESQIQSAPSEQEQPSVQ